MFNYKRVFGLVLLSTAALSGCGGGDGNKNPLPTCDNGQVLQGGQCVDRPPVCDAGTVRNPETGACEAVGFSGPSPMYLPADNEVVIYYNRQLSDQDYDGWRLYTFNEGSCQAWGSDFGSVAWPGTQTLNGATKAGLPAAEGSVVEGVIPPSGVDPLYGAFFVVPTKPNYVGCAWYIINNNAQGQQTSNSRVIITGEGKYDAIGFVVVPETGNLGNNEVAGVESPVCPGYDPDNPLTDVGNCVAPEPSKRRIADAAAHWIDAETIFWVGVSGEATDAGLYASSTGGLTQDRSSEDGAIIAGEGGDITFVGDMTPVALTTDQAERIPHLVEMGGTAFSLAGITDSAAKGFLKGQLLAIATDGLNADNETNRIGTAVQTARVIDDLYTAGENDADEATLGPVYADGQVTASLWAPTAVTVDIKLYGPENASGARVLQSTQPMTLDPNTGIWSYTAPQASLDGMFYLFSTRIYDPVQGVVVVANSTDPYSLSLSSESTYSQFVDLNNPVLLPEGWASHEAPNADMEPETASIYEGHIRDFSIRDESTTAANRGKYLAFTEDTSAPVQHLEELAAAGLTHFHLLPMFDMSSVIEDAPFQVNLNDTMADLCGLSTVTGTSLEAVCETATPTMPIISYLESLDPSTTAAQVVTQVLNERDGFNWGYDPYHFNVPEGSYASSAEGATRILELRSMVQALHEMGLRVVMDVVYNHTTASGLALKSVFDPIVPGYYHRRDPVTGAVEGITCCEDTAAENRMMAKFMADSLLTWSQAYKIDAFRFDLMTFHPKSVMQELLTTVAAVDPDVYFYGEGWEELGGSSGDDAIFDRATQTNMDGTGIGTFNDIMRDPLRNAALVGNASLDAVRLGLAGNLKDYTFYNRGSLLIRGEELGGYAADPQENVAYASKHDNATLWDAMHLSGNLATLTATQRARVQALTLSVPMLSQGVPFFHMGSDLLRSKSLDGNSYNSGDWFNYVDFTQMTNNWNVGVPVGADSANALIDDLEADPAASDIAWTSDVFNNFLAIAASTPLFSLETADEVIARVGFHNTGIVQESNLIVMSIDDGDSVAADFPGLLTADRDLADLDPAHHAVVVIFNGNSTAISHTIDTASGFELHPLQMSGNGAMVSSASATFLEDVDAGTGTFTVPAYSTAVFVKPQSGAQTYGLLAGVTVPLGGDIPNPFTVEPDFIDPIPYVRGLDISGWDALPARRLNYNNDGTFTALFDMDLTAPDADPTATTRTFNFKIADEGWNNLLNIGGAIGGSETVLLGEEFVLTETIDGDNQSSNLAITFPVDTIEDPESPNDSYYRFDVNALDVPPTLVVTQAHRLYMRGGFPGADDWSAVNELVWVEKDILQTEIDMGTSAVVNFKVADWTYADGRSCGSNGEPLVLNQAYELTDCAASSGNISFDFSTSNSTSFIFTVDQTDSVRTLTVSDTPLGAATWVRGSLVDNNWSALPENRLSYVGNDVLIVDLTVNAGTFQFKVADSGFENVNWGGTGGNGNTVVAVDGTPTALTISGSDNLGIVFDSAGTYRFTVDVSAEIPTLSVSPAP